MKTVVTISNEPIEEPLTSTSTSSDTESDSASESATSSDTDFLTREDEELSALRRETKLRLNARKREREEENIDSRIENNLRDYPKDHSAANTSLADTITAKQIERAERFYCDRPEFLELVNALEHAGHRSDADLLHYNISNGYYPPPSGIFHFAMLYAHEQEEKRRRIHHGGRHLSRLNFETD